MPPTGGTDCARCREVVSAGLDGEASAAELTAADAHLIGCPSCRDLGERMPLVDRWVRDVCRDDGPDLLDAVLAHVLGNGGPGDDHLAPVVGTVVPAAVCGCDPGCRCGCQDGRACRCARGAA